MGTNLHHIVNGLHKNHPPADFSPFLFEITREERKAAEALREMYSGDVLPASVINALIRAARAITDRERGYGPSDGGAFQSRLESKSVDIWIDATETIPPYSIFGVGYPAGSGAPIPRLTAHSVNGGPVGLFTNRHQALTTGQVLSVRAVRENAPTLVHVTGVTPGPGQPCGIKPGTFGVTAESVGLVCLSEPVDAATLGCGAEVADHVWVCRAHELGAILGEVTEAAPAFQAGTDTLGRGTLKVLYRDHDDDTLYEAVDPASGTSPWLLPFFNYDESAIAIGETILVDACAGVGLVYSPTGSGGSGSGLLELWGTMGTGSCTSSRTPGADQQSLQGLYRLNSFTDATTQLPSASGSRIYLPQDNGSGVLIVNQWRNDAVIYNPLPFTLTTNQRVRVSEMPLLTGSGSGRSMTTQNVYMVRGMLDRKPRHVAGATAAVNPPSTTSATASWVTSSDNSQIAAATSLGTSLAILCPVNARDFRILVQGSIGIYENANKPHGWSVAWRMLRNGTFVPPAGNLSGLGFANGWLYYGQKYTADVDDVETDDGVETDESAFDATNSANGPDPHTHSLNAHHHHLTTTLPVTLVRKAVAAH